MKNYLVPINVAISTNGFIEYASRIAQKENANITFLNVFHIYHSAPEIPANVVKSEIAHAEQNANEKLELLCSSINKSTNVKCYYISKFGIFADVILETISDEKPDLVIMGISQSGDILSSNTRKVIEKAKCPLIVVPQNAKYKDIKKIVFATDYHKSDIFSLKELVEIARPFNSEIIILHAVDESNIESNESQYLRNFKNKIKTEIEYENLTFHLAYGKHLIEVLDIFIETQSPDLIAMSTHHRNFFDKLFGASITQKMIEHIKIPVIAFHFREESVIFI